MASLSLVSSVLSTHKPPLWNYMPAGVEVQLEELDSGSQEFISAKNKIRQTLLVTVDRVQRVQNPYLFGKCDTAVCSSLLNNTVGSIIFY
jgi:hypothetical protein